MAFTELITVYILAVYISSTANVIFAHSKAVADERIPNLTIVPSATALDGTRTNITCADQHWRTSFVALTFGRLKYSFELNSIPTQSLTIIKSFMIQHSYKNFRFPFRLYVRSWKLSVFAKDRQSLSVSFAAHPKFYGPVSCSTKKNNSVSLTYAKAFLNVTRFLPKVLEISVKWHEVETMEVVRVTCFFYPGNPAVDPRLESAANSGWNQMERFWLIRRWDKGYYPMQEIVWQKRVQLDDSGKISCCVGSFCKNTSIIVHQARRMKLEGMDKPLVLGLSHLIVCSTPKKYKRLRFVLMRFDKAGVILRRMRGADHLTSNFRHEGGLDLVGGESIGSGIVVGQLPADGQSIAVRLTPSAGDNGTKVLCIGDEHKPVQRRLRVTWSPMVHSVNVEPPSPVAGQTMTVSCHFDPGDPSVAPQIIGLNGWTPARPGPERRDRRGRLERIASWRRTADWRDNGAEVKCLVGSSARTVLLHVRYAPELNDKFPERGTIVDVGSALSCSADANPPARVAIELRPEDGPQEEWTEVASGHRRVSGTLPMRTAEGRTILRCIARNDLGEHERKVVVSVRTDRSRRIIRSVTALVVLGVLVAVAIAVTAFRWHRWRSRSAKGLKATARVNVDGSISNVALFSSEASSESSDDPCSPHDSARDVDGDKRTV